MYIISTENRDRLIQNKLTLKLVVLTKLKTIHVLYWKIVGLYGLYGFSGP